MTEKRVGLFVNYGWLAVAPSLVSAIRLLAENGYDIDVIYPDSENFSALEFESDKVNLRPVKSGKGQWLDAIFFLIASLKSALFHKYRFFIGVDQDGIIAAGALAILKGIPYVYYSLEILTKEDILKENGARKFALLFRKFLENYFSRNADSTIVQDVYRAEVLIKDNGIDKDRIFFVPNSYYFFSEKPCNDILSEIALPPDKKIIIYTGSILPVMAIEDIISHMDLWPENAILILHTPRRNDYLGEIEKLIQRKNLGQRVVISIKQLSFEELACFLKKADIGLSFYRFVNKGFALGPSGKLSFYLSQGIPVISSKIPSVEDLVSKYKCGICVETPAETGEAIKTILNNHSEFSLNAEKCYENELEFSRYFKKFLDYYGFYK